MPRPSRLREMWPSATPYCRHASPLTGKRKSVFCEPNSARLRHSKGAMLRQAVPRPRRPPRRGTPFAIAPQDKHAPRIFNLSNAIDCHRSRNEAISEALHHRGLDLGSARRRSWTPDVWRRGVSITTTSIDSILTSASTGSWHMSSAQGSFAVRCCVLATIELGLTVMDYLVHPRQAENPD